MTGSCNATSSGWNQFSGFSLLFLELFRIKSDSQAIRDGANSSFCHRMNDITMQLSLCFNVLLPFPGLQIALIQYWWWVGILAIVTWVMQRSCIDWLIHISWHPDFDRSTWTWVDTWMIWQYCSFRAVNDSQARTLLKTSWTLIPERAY